MKNLFVGVLVCVFLVGNVIGSPLVFRKQITVKDIDFVDLGDFDTAKYKQIRIDVKVEKPESTSQRVNIYSFEDGKEISITGFSEANLNFSTLIENPPSKIKLKGRGNGTYFIYIYGNQ